MGNAAFSQYVARVQEQLTPAPAQAIQRIPAAGAIAARAAAFLGRATNGLPVKALEKVNTLGDTLGHVGGAVSAITPPGQGGHGAGAIHLPTDVMSATDMQKLKQIAQYQIVNMVCDQWVADPANKEIVDYLRNPSAAQGPPASQPNTPAKTPEPPAKTPEPPSVSADADDIKDASLEAAKTNMEAALQQRFLANQQLYDEEFWWGEDDSHDGEESIGVSGRVYTSNMVATAITEYVALNASAKLLKVPLPDIGEVTVRKLVSGSFHTQVVASSWDDLEISVSGGGPQVGNMGPDGSISFNLMTDWKWDGNTTAMDLLLWLRPNGRPFYTYRYSGTPDDNTWFPFDGDEGKHEGWNAREDQWYDQSAKRTREAQRAARRRGGETIAPGPVKL
jgi:hypothetical protein